MHICRIKSLYYICGICVQSIPALPNLCVHWKLASQGIKTQSTSWTPSLIFFRLLSHTLLLIPIEHAPSNQINEYNE